MLSCVVFSFPLSSPPPLSVRARRDYGLIAVKEGGKNHRPLFFFEMCGRFFFFSLVLLTLQIVFKKCCPLFSCLPSVWIGALRHSCEQLSCRSAAKRLSLFSLSIVSFFFFLILTARNWTKMCRLAPSLRFFHLYLVFPIMWGAHFFFFWTWLWIVSPNHSSKKEKKMNRGGRELQVFHNNAVH